MKKPLYTKRPLNNNRYLRMLSIYINKRYILFSKITKEKLKIELGNI